MSRCFISGGCFAAIIMLLGGCFATGSCFELGGCFTAVLLLWRMLCRRGRTFWWMFCHRFVLALLASLATVYPLFAGSALRVAFGWQVWSALLFLALAVCVFVCTFLQYFSVFSPLWSCIGQVLFGHIKSVSVTAFFLMKNVLWHGREKKICTAPTSDR